MTNQKFTQEEMELLKQNKYVINVTPSKVTYSLAFRVFAMQEAQKGTRSPEIFRKAGFDPEILGKSRMYSALKYFKREAASPEGLHEPWGKSKEARLEKFAEQDLAQKQTKVAIRELQNKIIHLEQQIEFLKKIQFPEQ